VSRLTSRVVEQFQYSCRRRWQRRTFARIIGQVDGLVASIAAAIEEQAAVTKDVANNRGETANYFAAPSVIISRTESLAGTLVA
jgi:hypothetical protein